MTTTSSKEEPTHGRQFRLRRTCFVLLIAFGVLVPGVKSIRCKTDVIDNMPRLVRDALAQRDALLDATFGTHRPTPQWLTLGNGDVIILIHRDGGSEIVLIRVNRDGGEVASTERLGVRTSAYKYHASLYSTKQDGFIVFWRQSDPRGLYARHVSVDNEDRWVVRVTEDDVLYYDALVLKGGEVIIVASNHDSVFASRIERDGRIGWGNRLCVVGVSSGSHNPVSIAAFPTDEDAVVIWYRFSDLKKGGNAYLAQRISLSEVGGATRWHEAVVLGEAPMYTLVAPLKVVMVPDGDSMVAKLKRGVSGDVITRLQDYEVRIHLDGSVERIQ